MTKNNDPLMHPKAFGWLTLATAIILSIPLTAMQFSDEVNWDLADFLIIGLLIMGLGSAFIIIARRLKTLRSRVITACLCGLMLLWLWAELAVGVFTNWGS